MVISRATTVKEYLDELPEERRKVIETVRKVILKNLPKGYRESMFFGGISYCVPLKNCPDTYNGQPLCYAGLAAQKNHFAVYLMCAYGDTKQADELRADFKKAGKKLDMGKACVRFKKLDDLPLDVIGKAIASVPMAKYISFYEKIRKK